MFISIQKHMISFKAHYFYIISYIKKLSFTVWFSVVCFKIKLGYCVSCCFNNSQKIKHPLNISCNLILSVSMSSVKCIKLAFMFEPYCLLKHLQHFSQQTVQSSWWYMCIYKQIKEYMYESQEECVWEDGGHTEWLV